jgi:HlyD family secretion protein
VDAYLGRKFKGVVTEIPVSAATTGVTTDQVTNFNVKILLLPESYKDLVDENNLIPFRPGMSATADIQTSRKYDVFTVPIQAVTTRPDTAMQEKPGRNPGNNENEEVEEAMEEIVVAFVAKNDTAFMRIVETGIQDERYIEIKAGIDPQDEVIVAPYSAVSKKLEDKSQIEIVKEEDLFKED